MSSSFLSVLIQRQAGKYGDRVALRYRDYKTETWIPVSWNQFAATVKTVSNALIELGIGIQENIAVFSQNKPECLYVDFGAFGVRAVTVPFYATSSEAQVHYMVGDAERDITSGNAAGCTTVYVGDDMSEATDADMVYPDVVSAVKDILSTRVI